MRKSRTADAIDDMTDQAPDDRYLDVGRARLRFRDEGRGAAVVFLHGWTLDLDMWEPQCAALRESYRVVRFDRRGFGLSTGEPSVAADVEDLAQLRRKLALDRIAVVGMSQGARVAVAFAAAAPQFVTCLVLHGPPNMVSGAPSGVGDVPIAAYRALIHADGIAAVRRVWAMHPLMHLTTRDERVRERIDAMLGRYRGLDLLGDEAAAPPAIGADPLQSIDAPTLLITGAHDLESRARAADWLAGRLARAERAVVPDAGHLANLDNSNSYNRILRSFLDRHVPVRA